MNNEIVGANGDAIIIPSNATFRMCHSFDPELENEMYAPNAQPIEIDENELNELINWMHNLVKNTNNETLEHDQ